MVKESGGKCKGEEYTHIFDNNYEIEKQLKH